jgi:hypothetical protein
VLLDAGRQDGYFEWKPAGQHLPSAIWQDGRVWRQPAPAELDRDYRSHGIGVDGEGGSVPEFQLFERRPEKK